MISEATTHNTSTLEAYFEQFRKHIVGQDQTFVSPFGEQKIIYTDWTASGRLYRPIEEKLLNERRLEFAFENKRWADLLRFGQAKSVMSAHLGIPEANVTLLYPIPQSAIDVTPEDMSQNPEHQ